MKRIITAHLFLVFSFLLFSGCGKNEATSGAVGAASGAVVGSALSSDRHKGTGALLGALIGHTIGREAGRVEDEEEESKERIIEKCAHGRELHTLSSENKMLKDELLRWCPDCCTKVLIAGAHSCPDCGTGLISEKFCDRCARAFKPECRYRYCPYCSRKVALRSR